MNFYNFNNKADIYLVHLSHALCQTDLKLLIEYFSFKHHSNSGEYCFYSHFKCETEVNFLSQGYTLSK